MLTLQPFTASTIQRFNDLDLVKIGPILSSPPLISCPPSDGLAVLVLVIPIVPRCRPPALPAALTRDAEASA